MGTAQMIRTLNMRRKEDLKGHSNKKLFLCMLSKDDQNRMASTDTYKVLWTVKDVCELRIFLLETTDLFLKDGSVCGSAFA